MAEAAHAAARRAASLPVAAPATAGGRRCGLCVHDCRIGEGERGYCGLKTVTGGRLVHLAGTPARGRLRWVRDPLPGRCVADWVCRRGDLGGSHCLAVAYAGCTLDCLACQTWPDRRRAEDEGEGLGASALAGLAERGTACACFYGGDPAAQMLHALAAARQLVARGVPVCWETSGTSSAPLLDHAVHLSLRSGGCVKLDLKAWSDPVHRALTGAPVARSLESFVRAARRSRERRSAPLVVASTPLVPGYVDADEVAAIARFVARVDRDIPYSILGFSPQCQMADLPPSTLREAEAAAAAARAEGLTRVRVANRELLSIED